MRAFGARPREISVGQNPHLFPYKLRFLRADKRNLSSLATVLQASFGGDRMGSIYHIATAADISRAARSGEYVPPGYAAEGFIHCSYASQVQAVADKYFAGRSDLVVLEIDPSRLSARVVDENLVGGAELYPHLYGSLPMSAVISIRELQCDSDGKFSLPCTVRG